MSSARNGLAFLKQMVKFRTEATKSFENVLQGVSRHLCTPRFLSFILYRPFELSPINLVLYVTGVILNFTAFRNNVKSHLIWSTCYTLHQFIFSSCTLQFAIFLVNVNYDLDPLLKTTFELNISCGQYTFLNVG